MSKATKRIIATITLVIVILLAGASIWWNVHSKEIYAEFETLITKELTETLGTNVKVGSLKINSPITASLRDVVIYDNDDKVIASVEEIVVYYQPLYLLFGNEPIDIISKINLKSPQVYLVQDIDETWNIEDIKMKESDQKTSFKINVFFENGDFYLSMPQGQKEIHKITGRIDFSKWPVADAFLRFNLEPEQDTAFDWRKIFTSTKRSMLKAVVNMEDYSALGSVKLPRIYPGDWQQFLPSDFPVEFKEGLLTDTEISFSYKDKKILYKGNLKLDDLAVEIKYQEIINSTQTILNDNPFIFTKTNAKVIFNNDSVHILDGETALLDEKFSVNGQIDLKEAEPNLDIILSAKNLETNSFFADKGLKGKINLDAYFKGRTSNLDAKAVVSWNEIFYKEQPIKLGEINLSFSNNTLFIEKGNVDFLNSKVLFLGNMNLENFRYALDLSGADLDLSELKGMDVKGIANIDLKSEGELKKP
ncbi:hypothetical protein LJC10_01955 [Selenomonadales bacterium OttesenSCG-928-I06]|nr:hypothetical protein [Selenomonadales bacterium OttesenSCG-928-I06]